MIIFLVLDLDTLENAGVDLSRPDLCFFDTDGDGIADHSDAFPDDASEWYDTDEDGIGNNTDTDDDNDGVLDVNDAFPLDSDETVDTDNDGTGDNADNCPAIANPDQLDANNNHIGDACEAMPTALDDSYTIYQNIALALDVATNDSDADQDSLILQSVSLPTNGTASITNSTVTYTPATDFIGTDSFTYTITDGTASGAVTATVNINVVANAVLVADIVFADSRLQTCVTNRGKTYANEIFLMGYCSSITDFSGIESLVNLADVYFRYGTLTTGLTPLASLNRLTKLILQSKNLTDTDISALSSMTQLTYLDLYNNQITDTSTLSDLTNLNYLRLQIIHQ